MGEIRLSLNEIKYIKLNGNDVEIRPVTHAHWRRLSDTWCKCSCCGHEMLRSEPRVYCPVCGAKMDEEVD